MIKPTVQLVQVGSRSLNQGKMSNGDPAGGTAWPRVGGVAGGVVGGVGAVGLVKIED